MGVFGEDCLRLKARQLRLRSSLLRRRLTLRLSEAAEANSAAARFGEKRRTLIYKSLAAGGSLFFGFFLLAKQKTYVI